MRNSRGFTLIELMLATALFSFVLLFVTASFVQINRAYNKGITIKRIHESTRFVIGELARTMSSASSSTGVNLEPNCMIVAGVRYKWTTGFVVPMTGVTTYAIAKDKLTDCNTAVDSSTVVELLDPKIMVHQLNVEQIGTSNTYRITLELGANRDDGAGANCSQITDAYCDRATLSTIVTLRH